ncbi:glycoside hydrolase family 43 protein [Sphingosinicella ginsenosidimutans]|uniref:Glycoside hydrolase family 43 protein n=1 Tax=Allosphingosinicella ginsenosidimutans TaxID=1176539 RepID=A0A5C6TWV3_9SPHN|nr:glycoside hydrolase family 43 protein [Sphingosinicella ginsenosidimutans]TXC64228.1 glycoside hydrolase family 43 protein [Sphingosinicella ginsenosidimutans]
MIRNPILPGFNPDPSIVRVGEDYYVATSTFEWFPGVQIHHSRDLENWRLVARPLDRASQLDLRGDPDGCGVWAPCLSHDGQRFHLVYTDVKRYGRTTTAGASGASLRDFHNYLVTAETIDGPWSDPVHLNSSGFDPSLFHDADGRKWLVNMLWDHRPGRNRFGGIVLQEYDPRARRLIGERRLIFKGTPLGLTEAPHLYRRGDHYYLLTAEGGTGWNHAVTMARARSIEGPYELHPDVHILSARDRPDAPLQRAGHADLVETPAGETWMVYLCGRPLSNRGRCVMGRETAIQKMCWGADGWLRTEAGDGLPVVEAERGPSIDQREDFDAPGLAIDFQWLRTPEPEAIFSLSARPGHLRLYGRESIGSLFTQALVARRQQAFCYSAACAMDFDPAHYQQAAGLVCYYNAAKFHYLHVSHDEALGRHIRVMSALPDAPQADAFTAPVAIPPGRIELRCEVDYERLRFAFRAEGQACWTWIPEIFDASILSDEASAPGLPNFTGAFVGLACQDMAGTARPADFDWFAYRERDYAAGPTGLDWPAALSRLGAGPMLRA